MSSVPMLGGATHALRLSPKAVLVPGSLGELDQFVKLGLLSDAKYGNWWAVATAGAKVGVVDPVTGVGCPRYVDANFNQGTKVGSLWTLAPVAVGRSLLLEAGAGVVGSNDADVFLMTNHVAASGFYESFTTSVDRAGLNPATGVDETWGAAGKLDLAYGFQVARGTKVYYDLLTQLDGASKATVHVVMKQAGNDPAVWMTHGTGLAISRGGGFIIVQSSATAGFIFDPAGHVVNDTYFLITVVFDGTAVGDDRLKVYVNDTLMTGSYVGDQPATLQPGGYQFEYGIVGGLSYVGGLDEARIRLAAPTADEVAWRYNNMMDDTYWDVTVQPVITGITALGADIYRISGTGLKPGAVDPTVTVSGTPYAVEVGSSDTQVDVVVNDQTGRRPLSLVNSDGEGDHATIQLVHSEIRSHGYNFNFSQEVL
jgi:hypothetical protein